MPRKSPLDIDEQAINHVMNNPDGLGIEELHRQLGNKVTRRTLQRRLSVLVDTGRLISVGAG